MVTKRRSNATIWIEVVEYFDGMKPDEMFHHFFVSPMRYYYLGGPDSWVFDKYLRQRKGLQVAHKRANTKPNNTSALPVFKGFVSYELTQEQWDEFDKSFPRAFQQANVWNDLLVACKLTVTPRESTFNACIFPLSNTNAGYALSSFADTAFEAMAICVFKYHLLRDVDWKSLKGGEKRARG